MKRKGNIINTDDLEPLIEFCVFPQELGPCLREFRMVLVRINLENLGGHAGR